MTRPTGRVLALLEILQAGGTRTAADLAERLGVDERTLRRYVEHLTGLDIPVRAVRGRYGGYRLEPGYRMPPLMLTDEEALAVLLGLVTGQRTGLVRMSAAAVESAAAKLRRTLPVALGRRLDALLQTAEFTCPAREVTAPEASVLLLLAEAARARCSVAIGYISGDGRRSARTVDPYGIVAHSGRWYVTGADSASGEVRTFRLDRISDPVPSASTFVMPDGFDPAAQLLAGIARAPHRHEIRLRVEGAAELVLARFPRGVATLQDAPGSGWVRVRMRADRLDWVPGVLAGLGLPFIIDGPDELRDLVRALAERLAQAARRPADTQPGVSCPCDR